jgi:hypothetical protein
MQTLVFVDNGKNDFSCGFQLSRANVPYAPKGRVRVARFTTYFHPLEGQGYYGDTYLRQLLRAWRRKHLDTKQRRVEKETAWAVLSKRTITDVVRMVQTFL